MALEEDTNTKVGVASKEVKTKPSTSAIDFGAWSSLLVELQSFRKEFGHANPSEGKLFEWLQYQRALFGQGNHSELHVSILRDMGCSGFGSVPQSLEEKKIESISVAASKSLPHSIKDTTDSAVKRIRTVTPDTKTGNAVDCPPVAAVKDIPIPEQVPSITALPTETTEIPRASSTDPRTDQQPVEMRPVQQLNDNDVVCGGAISPGYHMVINFLPGNIQFVDMVQAQAKYASTDRNENVDIAESIVRRVLSMDPPGRFVVKNDDAWAEISNEEAIAYALKVICDEIGVESDDEGAEEDGIEDLDAADSDAYDSRYTVGNVDAEMVDVHEPAREAQPTANKPRDHYASHWEGRFQTLVEFKKRNGHANPKSSRNSPDLKLGKWLSDQRRSLRNGRLDKSRALRLRDLGCKGFDSVSPSEDADRKPVHVLMADYEETQPTNGTTRKSARNSLPPSSYEDDMAQQRAAFFWLEDQTMAGNRSSTWRSNYLALKDFCENRDNARPSWDSEEALEHHLAGWLIRQKELYDRERLCQEQITLLKYLNIGVFDESENEESDEAEYPEIIRSADASTKEQETDDFDDDEAALGAEMLWGSGTDRRLTWSERCSQLVAYKRRYGHANPVKSTNASEEESKLGRWLKDQVKIYDMGRLPRERVRQLRKLGCNGFEARDGEEEEEDEEDSKLSDVEDSEIDGKQRSLNDQQWEARFEQLLEYKKEHGNANPVRSKYVGNEEYSLASWVTSQRMRFREGKLEDHKVKRLQSIGCKGFILEEDDCVTEGHGSQKNCGSINDAPWENRYKQLCEFKKRNGHCDPKRSQDADRTEFKLGSFLTAQRMKYREGTLARSRVLQLRELGCPGFGGKSDGLKCKEKPPVRRSWNQNYDDLKTYKEQYGHPNPRRVTGPWFELGSWLGNQRYKFRHGTLSDERAEKLRSMGCSGFNDESDDDGENDEVIERPLANDVVCGRGGHTNNWPGNVKFRKYVNSRKEEYAASRKHRKMAISKEVVKHIQRAGGRFLKNDGSSWVEVGDARAFKKASQALREGTLQSTNGELQSDNETGNECHGSDETVSHRSSDESDGGSCSDESERSEESSGDITDEESEGSGINSDSETEDKGDAGDSDRDSDSDSDDSLDDLGRVVETGCVPWSTRYKQLRAYKKRNGHANPGCAKGPDYAVGHWLSDQRYKYRKGTLPEDKIELLNSLGCHGFGQEEFVAEKSLRTSQEQDDFMKRSKKSQTKKRRRLGIDDGTSTATSPNRPGEERAETTTRSGRASKKKKNDYLFY